MWAWGMPGGIGGCFPFFPFFPFFFLPPALAVAGRSPGFGGGPSGPLQSTTMYSMAPESATAWTRFSMTASFPVTSPGSFFVGASDMLWSLDCDE